MFVRKLKMLMRDREAAVLGSVAILTVLLSLTFLGKMAANWRFYLSPSYRHDATAVLNNLRSDTGWGLSNFDITRTSCDRDVCEMNLAFGYHGPSKIQPPSATFRISWTKGKPDTYAIRAR